MFYYPQFFIAHNTDNIAVLVPRFPTKNRVLPRGVTYPHFGNHCNTGNFTKPAITASIPKRNSQYKPLIVLNA